MVIGQTYKLELKCNLELQSLKYTLVQLWFCYPGVLEFTSMLCGMYPLKLLLRSLTKNEALQHVLSRACFALVWFRTRKCLQRSPMSWMEVF